MLRSVVALPLFFFLVADDGRWANSPHKEWFNGLKNQTGGLCCSMADGNTIEDPDWKIDTNGRYAVKIDGLWFDVSPYALVKGHNRLGRAIVWPARASNGSVFDIRCFMPGTES